LENHRDLGSIDKGSNNLEVFPLKASLFDNKVLVIDVKGSYTTKERDVPRDQASQSIQKREVYAESTPLANDIKLVDSYYTQAGLEARVLQDGLEVRRKRLLGAKKYIAILSTADFLPDVWILA